jgi:nicotinamidase/pyrazinamidase
MTNKALLLVDLQNDFMPGGALAVPRGHEVVPIANQLQACFETVIATQDWHPSHHSSFHTLWPPHCIQNSVGAALVGNLNKTKINKIIYKGVHPEVDSYSAFFDNDHQKKTDLDEYLKSKNISEIYVMGLATDYCAKFTVLDALSLGYKVNLIQDGCRGIDLQPGDSQKAITEMQNLGAHIIQSSHVLPDKQLVQ